MLDVQVVAERLRSRLWPIPAAAAVAAGTIAVGLSPVRPDPSGAPMWWPGEPSSARGLLQVLTGASLTVVALVFSLHVVALQLAATQYSPRLLRTYVRDGVIQASLAVLIATFVFSLVTLALFGAREDPPRVSVSVAVLLGLASVAALVGVVAHIVSSLRIETLMAELHAHSENVIGQAHPDDAGPVPSLDAAITWATPMQRLVAQSAGFVQAVDRRRLAGWAHRHDAWVRIDVPPGDHVLAGRPVGRVWSTSPGVVPDTTSMVLVGHERTPDEDPAFGVVQLVDITLRAMSPGVNDPTTAVHAVGHLASLLTVLADRTLGDDRVTNGPDGDPRVWEIRRGLSDYLDLACRPIVRTAAADPRVLLAVVDLLAAVRRTAGATAAAEVARQGDYVSRAARRDMGDDEDRTTVLAAVERMMR